MPRFPVDSRGAMVYNYSVPQLFARQDRARKRHPLPNQIPVSGNWSHMSKIILVFPAALIAGLLLFFVKWFIRVRKAISVPEGGFAVPDGELPDPGNGEMPCEEGLSSSVVRLPIRRGLPEAPDTDRRLTRRDALLASIMTVLCAISAFVGLGDTVAPKSCCDFSDWGSYVDIAFNEPVSIGHLMYYSGLYTGTYYLQFSQDGEEYVDVGTMEQSYTELFKWNRFVPDALAYPATSLRIVANAHLELGELAIYDTNGKLISPESISCSEGAAPLFDEQELVPEDGYSLHNSSYFDEIYHPRTAYEHIRDVKPYEVSHPPLGKLILSLGIRMFGMTPFGWRFMGTLFGALMLPILYAFLKKLFGSTPIAFAGTAIMATDFMHYAQTRLATIDTYAVFFILLMYLFLYLFFRDDPDAPGFRRGVQTRNLFFSGLFFGLGAASKWTCIYAGMGLAVLWLLYWIFRAKKLLGEKRGRDFVLEFGRSILLCLAFFVLIPAVIYYLSYTPYGRAEGMQGLGMYFRRDYLQLVLDNQDFMLHYHVNVTGEHPYSSRWYEWILNLRPILYYQQFPTEQTKSAIAAFVNPLLCWGGLLALIATAWLGIRTRDKKALFLLVGYLAQLLPWVFISRLTFAYHYFTCVPFLIFALCYCFDALRRLDLEWRQPLLLTVLISLLIFVLFFPALHGITMPRWYFKLLRWLPRWPL